MGGLIGRFLIDESGGITVEYALAVGLAGVAAALALAALGDALDQGYEQVAVVTSQGSELSHQREF